VCAREANEQHPDLPVAGGADVIVCGGGLGGVVAAIASARNGSDTLLVERAGFLGGSAAAGLTTTLAGFRSHGGSGSAQLVRGIGQEIVRELIETQAGAVRRVAGDVGQRLGTGGSGGGPSTGVTPYAIRFDPQQLTYVVLRMCQEAGVRLLLDTWGCGAVVEGAALRYLVIESKSRRQALRAAITVDATGNGDIAAAAGVPHEVPSHEEAQAVETRMMYRLAGADMGAREGAPEGIVSRAPAASRPRHSLDVGTAGASARLAAQASLEEIRRRRGRELQTRPEAEEATLERPTRRIRAEYALSHADAMQGRRFRDAIAICPAPPIAGGREPPEHEGFDVPYRALLPLQVEGLLLAGECVSAEHGARRATAMAGPNMAISQAAGTAAALCVRDGRQPRELDVRLLQGALVAQGAELLGRP
jgi:2-polyprenyl-6-methoxyphenol hydroxylase-like FAD-dependent oxidoreductase